MEIIWHSPIADCISAQDVGRGVQEDGKFGQHIGASPDLCGGLADCQAVEVSEAGCIAQLAVCVNA
ncbi:hypothetical protein [Sinorhizobium meliloti]|uniref:hypothetical protein n=1 Tax=Rhizobium meliloti TaxID=382 RepID=UPI000FD72CF2|nr:hypothetical protein [Sinorhizobium meliloti]RVJ43833.1 hypothetical protein CN175_31345 [Sinorhizobium meliloti]RVJ84018.1 hypothetical protein CN169_32905 [Sinorhizobium meliloti]